MLQALAKIIIQVKASLSPWSRNSIALSYAFQFNYLTMLNGKQIL